MTEIEPHSLGEVLPREMNRIRDVVIPQYRFIGPTSVFAITMMHAALDRAAKALAENDATECIRAYEELRSFKS